MISTFESPMSSACPLLTEPASDVSRDHPTSVKYSAGRIEEAKVDREHARGIRLLLPATG
jgi:hypothetical protein